MEGCFLCSPDDELVFSRANHSVGIAGLGPIVPGYSLFTTSQHWQSIADIEEPVATAFSEFFQETRKKLSDNFGECLITEHGRVPVCVEGENDIADAHCYHAHCLVFPGAPDITEEARTYFRKIQSFSSMPEALNYARNEKDYLLISPNLNSFHIMSGPLNLPRQFARTLVAIRNGRANHASWRNFPEREKAIEIAKTLRSICGG